MMKQKRHGNNPPWKEYFTYHPHFQVNKKQNRPVEVYASVASNKFKVFCNFCLDVRVGQLLGEEEERKRSHPGYVALSRGDIILNLFRPSSDKSHEWTENRASTLYNHLRICVHASPEAKAEAIRETVNANVDAEDEGGISLVPQGFSQMGLGMLPGMSAGLPFPYVHVTPPAIPSDALMNIQPEPSRLTRSRSATPASAFQIINPLLINEQFRSRSVTPTSELAYAQSIAPGSQYTMGPGLGAYYPPQGFGVENGISSKRARTNSSGISRRGSLQDLSGWNEDRQKSFEEQLICVTAACDFSLSWVENPQVVLFFQMFLPNAQLPSRRTLSDRILSRTLEKIDHDITTEITTSPWTDFTTLQCDGWTGGNMHHIIGFMATIGRKLYTVDTIDVTTERKTAENLLGEMCTVIEKVEKEWKSKVIAFTTDASGESRKARRLLREKFPFMVTPDCYAHQINLIVGDYFKSKQIEFLGAAEKANNLIAWLRSKTGILGLIQGASATLGRQELSVIRPVPTRWTAFFLAYLRLLELHETLEYIISADNLKPANERIIVPLSPPTARKKAIEMVSLIRDPLFWHSLTRIKLHLEPLAIAANITQSAFCRLDEVLITFGHLFRAYQTSSTDDQDEQACDAILQSLEGRWAKADQQVFVAAVILNPFFKLNLFQKNAYFSYGAINTLLSSLWVRFFGDPVPVDFRDDIRAYLKNSGPRFSNFSQRCVNLQYTAAGKRSSPDPLEVWEDVIYPGESPSGLYRLAIHVLSICANSASCERLFSTLGLILTKLRTRLSNKRLLGLAKLKMHSRDKILRTTAKADFRARIVGVSSASSSNPTVDQMPMAQVQLQTSSSGTTGEPGPLPPPTTPASGSSSTRSLMILTDQLIRDLAVDDHDEAGIYDINQDRDTGFPVKLVNLFDFGSAQWSLDGRYSAIRSLDEELEFYQLLEFDAAGEEDIDHDLESVVESVLFEG